FIPGIARAVKGTLAAGAALADLVTWMAKRSIVIVQEVVKGALVAGATIGQLIIDTVTHPENVMQNLMTALDSLGKTLKNVFEAAIIETAQEFLKEVVIALVKIGKAILDILLGVLEVLGGAIDTVIIILCETL